MFSVPLRFLFCFVACRCQSRIFLGGIFDTFVVLHCAGQEVVMDQNALAVAALGLWVIPVGVNLIPFAVFHLDIVPSVSTLVAYIVGCVADNDHARDAFLVTSIFECFCVTVANCFAFAQSADCLMLVVGCLVRVCRVLGAVYDGVVDALYQFVSGRTGHLFHGVVHLGGCVFDCCGVQLGR